MASARFRRGQRIHGDALFARIRAQGAAAGDKVLFIRALRNRLGATRLGLAVGRAAGNAVKRSRLRRVIREAFRHSVPGLPVGLDLLVAPRGGAAGAAPEALRRSLAALAARLDRELPPPDAGPSPEQKPRTQVL